MTDALVNALLRLPTRLRSTAFAFNPYIINSHFTPLKALESRHYFYTPSDKPEIAWVAKAREHHLNPFLQSIYTGVEERLLHRPKTGAVVWWCEEMPVSFTTIVKSLPVKAVIVFGLDPHKDLSLRCNADLYCPIELQIRKRNIVFLVAEALGTLKQTPTSKKRLWYALKAIFTPST